MNEWKKYAVICIIALIIGFLFGSNRKTEKIPDPTQPTTPEIKTETKTETQIVYVPKQTVVYVDSNTGKEITAQEKTDIQANIGKPSVNVKINGNDAEIKKSDDERFVFDKNKLILNQASTINIATKIDPVVINKTKHWGIGVGYGSHDAAGIVLFPVDKTRNIDGFIYMDKNTKTGGIMIRF